MTDRPRPEPDTTAVAANADAASRAGARRLRTVLAHPFMVGFLAVLAAAALFRTGIVIGETTYLAVEGNVLLAIGLGATLVTAVVAIIATGVWLDRRRRLRDADPHTSDADR